MERKYIVVRVGSTSGPYGVERNSDAPRRCAWSKADIAGYANSRKRAEEIAREANEQDEDE